MIQRIQSLFLVAILILSVLLVFLPFQEIVLGTDKFVLCLMPGCLQEIVRPFIYVPMMLNFLVIIFSFAAIFLYKNRPLQIKLSRIIFIFSILLGANLFTMKFTTLSVEANITPQIIAFFPAVNAVLAALAMRFIKKDEELVRSADRIR